MIIVFGVHIYWLGVQIKAGKVYYLINTYILCFLSKKVFDVYGYL